MRRRARVDANHQEIAAAFEATGYTVLSLAPMGRGVPDLLIGTPAGNVLIEVKDGSKPPSARKLTTDERRFHDTWRGPIKVVEKLSDVLALVREWRYGVEVGKGQQAETCID